MIKVTEDIRPLTDFKRNTSHLMRQMKKTHRPVVLTVNGKAELVVQDAAGYEQLLTKPDELEAVAAIRVGIAAAEEGRTQPARQALAALQTKLGI